MLTVQNRQTYQDEQFLRSFPNATGDEVAAGHITHVTVTISHIEWFIHDRNFDLLVDSGCFHPLYCPKVTPGPYSNATPFQFQFLGP